MASAVRKHFLSSRVFGRHHLVSISKRSFSFALSGIYPQVVSPEFTFSNCNKIGQKKEFDFHRFSNILRFLDRYPISGYVLQAPSPHLDNSNADYFRLLSQSRHFLGHHRVIFADLADDINTINTASSAGADAVLIATKSRLSDKDLISHFRKIANFSRIPLILHNAHHPRDNFSRMPTDVICELAQHPNIVGVLEQGTKDDGIKRVATICTKTKPIAKPNEPFDVVTASAATFLPALAAGSSGIMTPLANLLPFELWSLQNMFRRQKIKEAEELQGQIIGLDQLFSDPQNSEHRIKIALETCLNVNVFAGQKDLLNGDNKGEADRVIGAFKQFAQTNIKKFAQSNK